MTGFAIGMLAAAMWLGVMVAVWYLFKTSPGHPFRSISRFRWLRRSIGRQVSVTDQPAAGPLEMPLATKGTLVEATSGPGFPETIETTGPSIIDIRDDVIELHNVEDDHTDRLPVSITQIASGVDPGMESIDMDQLLGAVTAEKKPRKPRVPAAPSRGPRKIGRTTYVLVDDEGRPLV